MSGARTADAMLANQPEAPQSESARTLEVFFLFLRLGCLSFGGPIAHLGYFRAEFVERRRWLNEEGFAELVALAQSMPGPASSQAGFAIGLLRAGMPGALAAWLGFTLPSALLMLGFAYGYGLFASRFGQGLLHALQLVAVAVVAQAVLTMQRSLAPDRLRLGFALGAMAIVLVAPATIGSVLSIALGAGAGLLLLKSSPSRVQVPSHPRLSKMQGAFAGSVFAVLLLLSLALGHSRTLVVAVFAGFYRVGALVFGGGHVVLPLLNELVTNHQWMSPETFVAGYGAAQALPGPLFCFAAYLGAALRPTPHPLLLGLLALVSIFLPGLLLMTAVLPFWSSMRRWPAMQRALAGINASVVGVLIAALYRPVWTSTVHSAIDFAIALIAFALLTVWKLQPWLVVLLAAAAGLVCVLFGLQSQAVVQ